MTDNAHWQRRLEEEIEARMHALFDQLARGMDAPPAQIYRLEGMLEAAVLCGAGSVESWQDRIEACHDALAEQPLGERAGENWRELLPFPQLPAWMKRAPVYPTTGD
jgi:hypothetical protein